jgi:glutathione synthase
MRTLFVMDPLDRINVAGDSTYMLMRETTARGHEAAWCRPADLYVIGGRTHARLQRVRTFAAPPHFHCDDWTDASLGDFDVVWMRKDPPFDMEYIFATYLLEKVPSTTLVLNDPAAIRSHNEKLFANEFVEFSPPTLISRDAARIAAFSSAAPDRIVLKPWDGNGGRGVLVAQKGDRNLRAMIEVLTQEGRTALIAQHYLPAIAEGDKRILLVDGEPVGAMLRVPGADDHRGNMHVGATVQATTLTPADRRICEVLSPRLKSLGLLFVGIDVIGGFLTEINVTSPTGIQEINRLDGVRIEAQVLDATAARLAARRSRSHA